MFISWKKKEEENKVQKGKLVPVLMILLEGKIPQEEKALLSIFNSSEVSVGMNFWILDPRVSRLCS